MGGGGGDVEGKQHSLLVSKSQLFPRGQGLNLEAALYEEDGMVKQVGTLFQWSGCHFLDLNCLRIKFIPWHHGFIEWLIQVIMDPLMLLWFHLAQVTWCLSVNNNNIINILSCCKWSEYRGWQFNQKKKKSAFPCIYRQSPIFSSVTQTLF